MDPIDRKSLGKAGFTTEEINNKITAGRERELQKLICNYLNLLDVEYGYSNPSKKTTYTVGWPDFCFPYKGIFVSWEIKTIAGKMSKEQVKVLERLAKQGAQVRKICSLAEAQAHLREIDRESLWSENIHVKPLGEGVNARLPA